VLVFQVADVIKVDMASIADPLGAKRSSDHTEYRAE